MNYEYGIQHSAGDSTEPHRTGMTREEAHKWIFEFIADGGRITAFYVIRRPLGEWEKDPPTPEEIEEYFRKAREMEES